MVFLVLLNGIPASGKSTVARAWVERHAPELPVALDIDVLRAMVGGWEMAPLPAGEVARATAVAAIRALLSAGHDVIVPQYARRAAFIETLDAVAADAGAAFIEFALRADPDVAERRFAARAADGTAAQGALAARMADLHAELETFLDTRTHVRRVGGPLRDVEDVVDEVDAVLAAAREGTVSG